MTRTYAEPTYPGKEALVEAMNAELPDQLAPMIIAAALEEEDRAFVENACILLSMHPDEIVRGNAILAMGHIARIFGDLSEPALTAVKRGLDDASDYVRGQAHAAAGDLNHFLGIEVRQSKRRVGSSGAATTEGNVGATSPPPTLDSLLVRPVPENSVGDLGFLMEAAAVYRDVAVYVNRTALRALVTNPSRDMLFELLEENGLRMVFHPDFPGVITNSDRIGNSYYDFGVALIEGRANDVFSSVEQALREQTGNTLVARTVAAKAARLVRTERLDEQFLTKTRANLLDEKFMTEVALLALQHFSPKYPTNQSLYFRLRNHWGRLAVESNIDFRLATQLAEKGEGLPSRITPAWILAQYQAATVDLHLIESIGVSAVATAPLHSRLLATVFARTSKRLAEFRDFTFDAGLKMQAGTNTSDDKQLLDLIRNIRRRHQSLVATPEDTLEFLSQVRSEVQTNRLPSRRLVWRVPISQAPRKVSDQFLAP